MAPSTPSSSPFAPRAPLWRPAATTDPWGLEDRPQAWEGSTGEATRASPSARAATLLATLPAEGHGSALHRAGGGQHVKRLCSLPAQRRPPVSGLREALHRFQAYPSYARTAEEAQARLLQRVECARILGLYAELFPEEFAHRVASPWDHQRPTTPDPATQYNDAEWEFITLVDERLVPLDLDRLWDEERFSVLPVTDHSLWDLVWEGAAEDLPFGFQVLLALMGDLPPERLQGGGDSDSEVEDGWRLSGEPTGEPPDEPTEHGGVASAMTAPFRRAIQVCHDLPAARGFVLEHLEVLCADQPAPLCFFAQACCYVIQETGNPLLDVNSQTYGSSWFEWTREDIDAATRLSHAATAYLSQVETFVHWLLPDPTDPTDPSAGAQAGHDMRKVASLWIRAHLQASVSLQSGWWSSDWSRP